MDRQTGNGQTGKLTTKDFTMAGAFSALYVVPLVVVSCSTLERGMVKAYYPLDKAGIEKIQAYFNAKTGGYEIVQESALICRCLPENDLRGYRCHIRGAIASVVPFFLAYRIIRPILMRGEA